MSDEHIILKCDFQFICPKEWDKLALTDDPKVRYCQNCEKQVVLTRTRAELAEHQRTGTCIAAWVEDLSHKPKIMIGGAAYLDEKPIPHDAIKLHIIGSDQNRLELLQALEMKSRKNRLKKG